MIVLYDGTFDGYLSLVYAFYYKKLSPSAIIKELPNELIMEEVYEIQYDVAEAQKVLEALKKKFTKEHFETILNVFMCDNSAFELDLLHYIIVGFKSQRELQNINNKHIFAIHNLQKELFHNYHKMSGFLRFEELEDGSLYARLDSKFSLVYLLGRFFSKRFNNQNYIIHDIKRKLAYIHTPEFSGVKNVAEFEAPTLSDNEEKFRSLWKTFFTCVTIQTRKNPKLQRQLVPLLYRTYMSEFN